MLFELWILPVLCELYLTTDRAELAAESVERGFALLAPNRNWYGLAAGMHLARGMLARDHRDWDDADASFEQAVAINHDQSLPWDEAKALYEWAQMAAVRDRAGDRDAARERRRRARSIFEHIGARKDVEKIIDEVG